MTLEIDNYVQICLFLRTFSKTTILGEQEVNLILQNEDSTMMKQANSVYPDKKKKRRRLRIESNPIFSKVHNDIPVCITMIDDDAGIASLFIGFA